jgi:hypothetical protein
LLPEPFERRRISKDYGFHDSRIPWLETEGYIRVVLDATFELPTREVFLGASADGAWIRATVARRDSSTDGTP